MRCAKLPLDGSRVWVRVRVHGRMRRARGRSAEMRVGRTVGTRRAAGSDSDCQAGSQCDPIACVCVCVCVCVHARAPSWQPVRPHRMCVCVCVCVHARARARAMHVHVCVCAMEGVEMRRAAASRGSVCLLREWLWPRVCGLLRPRGARCLRELTDLCATQGAHVLCVCVSSHVAVLG